MAAAPDVDALLLERAHPLAATIEAVRAQLLAVSGVVESIKWNAPNYALADDFATMSLRRDAAVQVILHTGAKPKPDHPQITLDPLPDFARWADRNRAVLTFTDAALSPDDTTALRAAILGWTAQLV